MTALDQPNTRIALMGEEALAKVQAVQDALMQMEQATIPVQHVLHGGMYARTVRIPAGVAIAGAFVRVPTILVINGKVSAYANDQMIQISGYQVIVASAGRKQIFIAQEDTDLTMLFATTATTVEQAEQEFTSEAHMLASRGHEGINTTIITGE